MVLWTTCGKEEMLGIFWKLLTFFAMSASSVLYMANTPAKCISYLFQLLAKYNSFKEWKKK